MYVATYSFHGFDFAVFMNDAYCKIYPNEHFPNKKNTHCVVHSVQIVYTVHCTVYTIHYTVVRHKYSAVAHSPFLSN